MRQLAKTVARNLVSDGVLSAELNKPENKLKILEILEDMYDFITDIKTEIEEIEVDR